MENMVQPGGPDAKRSRQSIRLTFRIAEGKVSLVSHERLNMISPPSIGERPVIGKHGGFWIEMRDGNRQPVFYRPLFNPLGDSVEVHSPDGKIERVFGQPEENTFEVLLPDDPRARTVAIIGESLIPAVNLREKMAASHELASFSIPEGLKGRSNDRGSGEE